MFLNPSKAIFRCVSRKMQSSFYCSQNTANLKWDIWTAVCVERLPLVTPPLTDLQSRYKDYLSEVENEKSMKSNHEMRHEADLKYAELLKTNISAADLDEVSKVTAQDFEDASYDEFVKFQCASILTEADKKNDQKSLERNLQNHLILVVEQNLGQENMFILPQGKHCAGETLRQTAERIVQEMCGEDLQVEVYGNAPYGFYKYKYPNEIDGVHGAKVFFYYGRHKSGQMKGKTEFKWLNRKELEKGLPERYFKSVNKFLVEERL